MMNQLFRTTAKTCIYLLLLFSCHNKKGPLLDRNINPELEKVLTHYKASGEGDKLKAARFLITYMEGLGTDSIQLFDAQGAPTALDLTSFADGQALRRAVDSLNIFYKARFVADADVISSDAFLRNIDQAFEVWEKSPFSRALDFDSFCEYLLPHRVDREPLEDWRRQVQQAYGWVADSLGGRPDIRSAVNMINDNLQSWFSFGKAHYKPDKTLSISEMVQCQKGGCEAMSNLALFTMRALGIAVMKDFAPVWAAANGGHCWNSVYLEGGELCSFQGCEGNILAERPHSFFPFDNGGNLVSDIGYRKSGKVYRYTYSVQENTLAEVAGDEEAIPYFFRNNNRYIDVTHEYMPVVNVSLALDGPVKGQSYAYICTFNNGRWAPIHWSRISKNREVQFNNMGRDIVYLVAAYQRGRSFPLSRPFFVGLDGGLRWLDPDSTQLQDLTIRKRSRDIFFDLPKFRIHPGKGYQLYCWQENRWALLGSQTAASDSLVFPGVPTGGIPAQAGGGREEGAYFPI